MQRSHSSPHIRGRRLDKNRTAPFHFASSNYDVNLFYSQLRSRARTSAAEESIDASAAPLYRGSLPWSHHSSRPGSPSMFIVSAGGRRNTNFIPSPVSTVEKARPHRHKTVGGLETINPYIFSNRYRKFLTYDSFFRSLFLA